MKRLRLQLPSRVTGAFVLWALLFTAALVGRAEARQQRLRLERIDASKCATRGTVRAFVTELELEGIVRPLTPKALHLVVGGEAAADTPLEAIPFAETEVPLRVALVIQASLGYQADIPRIAAAATTFVRKLPPRTSVSVVVYGWQADALLPRGTPADAERVLANLSANQDAGTLALIPALERGLALLSAPLERPADGGSVQGAATPASAAVVRRLLVPISDGLNRDLGRVIFRSFADKAKAAGVPIHPIAYSPSDERQPLLNLGELAKRSIGTLRWVKTPTDFRAQFVHLAEEVNQQLALTFKVPDRCQTEHTVQVSHGVLRSNTLVLAKQAAQPSPSSRLWLLIALVAGGLVLSALALLLARGLRH